jgi:hypothetical protein
MFVIDFNHNKIKILAKAYLYGDGIKEVYGNARAASNIPLK